MLKTLLNIRFEVKILIGFLITLVLITTLGIYSYVNNEQQLETSRWVNYTNEVLYSSEQLLSAVIDVETGQRGYSLSGEDDFLEPYFTAKDSLEKYSSMLLQLVEGNKKHEVQIKKLKLLIDKKLAFSNRAIKDRSVSLEKNIATISSQEGKRLMDQIRSIIYSFQAEEKNLLNKRRLEHEKQITKFNIAFFATLGTTVLILFALFYMIYINLQKRKKAETKLLLATDEIKDLYDHAPCGYHSLDANGTFIGMNKTMLRWLGYEAEEILDKKKITDVISPESMSTFQTNFPVFKKQGFIKNLEFDFVRKDGSSFPGLLSSSAVMDDKGNYLKSRSTTFDYTEQKLAKDKIHRLNNELEAFSYSVSHDLRTPLRSITGYAQILQEDYSAQLDDEGKRVTGIIVKNTIRMGQLIDDLLDFSKIGRKELSSAHLNTNTMVQHILRDLCEQEPHRTFDITTLPLHDCTGDINMMRQVWVNLISNALKYSQKKDITQIQIGSYEDAREVCYYIKDNGAGFDMKYVHKLFGVFQRLHKINEFEGTGVGLALVKRIIERHNGRVWAEGKLNEGATFYFSLPTISTI